MPDLFHALKDDEGSFLDLFSRSLVFQALAQKPAEKKKRQIRRENIQDEDCGETGASAMSEIVGPEEFCSGDKGDSPEGHSPNAVEELRRRPKSPVST